jgi:hypothetical protein
MKYRPGTPVQCPDGRRGNVLHSAPRQERASAVVVFPDGRARVYEEEKLEPILEESDDGKSDG